MQRKSLTLLSLSAVIAMSLPVFADSHLDQSQQRAIDARQSHMTLYGFNLGPIGAMAQGRIPYDAAVASAAAANLAAMGGMNQDAYWLEGTDASAGNNRAKPEIWTDAEGFAAEQVKFAEATVALAAVAGDGLDAMRAALGPVGQSCGSCHESYRAPRN